MKSTRPPYGWTLLPRAAALCCAPALAQGLVFGALYAFDGLFPDDNAPRHAAMSAALRIAFFFDVPAVVLAPVAAVLGSIVRRSRRWSDRVVVVLLCLIISAAAALVVRWGVVADAALLR